MQLKLSLATLMIFFSSLINGQPVYKGGARSLATFINNNQIYPEYSKSNCLQGIVVIRFKLNSTGEIYHSEVDKGFGTDLDTEALRVVRLTSGKWQVPAGYDTTLSIALPVNFSLKDYKCEEISSQQKNEAINAWNARKSMTEGIYNFYDKKYAGQFDPADEARILEIRAQLGYDEKFFERLLKQGKAKLKQGDTQGACEDFQTIRRLGSNISAEALSSFCQ